MINDIISPTNKVFSGDKFKDKNGNIIHDMRGLQYPFIASINLPCAYVWAMLTYEIPSEFIGYWKYFKRKIHKMPAVK